MIQVLELNIRKFCFLEFHNAIKAGSRVQCASRVTGIMISKILCSVELSSEVWRNIAKMKPI